MNPNQDAQDVEHQIDGIRFEYVVGKRAGSNLVWVPAEMQFFKKHSEYKEAISFRCYIDKCPARASLRHGVLVRNDKLHLHEEQTQLYDELQARKEMLKQVGDLKTAPIRQVFNDVMERHQDSTIKFKNVRRSLQRRRAESMPASPESVKEIIEAFNDPEVNNIFGVSKHNDSREFFITAYREDLFSYCIFASKASIELMEGHIEETERHILMDATFKVVPAGFFTQLLIIFVEYVDKVFPLVYVLMNSKTEAAYSHVFEYVNNNIVSLKCKSFTTDYEAAMRKALKKQFSDAQFFTCWFHFTQAVKRNAASTPGFFDRVRNDKDLTRCYYKLLCLPLLPPEKISPSFMALKTTMLVEPVEPLRLFLGYYERQWIIKEGPEKNSVFKQHTRTTCAVEAYNGAIGRNIQGGLKFFRFVDALRSEEFARWKEFRDHVNSGGDVTNSNRKSATVVRNDRINKCTRDLIDGKILALVFLNRVSYKQHKILPDSAVELPVETAEPQYAEEIEETEKEAPPLAKCVVCLVNPVKVLLLPCKHLCLCEDCWTSLQQNERQRQGDEVEADVSVKCPTCRQEVCDSMEVFV